MHNKNKKTEKSLRFPCLDKNGKYVTLVDCDICHRRNACDIYITMISENDDRNRND